MNLEGYCPRCARWSGPFCPLHPGPLFNFRLVDAENELGLPFAAGARVTVERPADWHAGPLWWGDVLEPFHGATATVVGVPFVAGASPQQLAYDGTVCYLDVHDHFLFSFSWLRNETPCAT